MHYLATTLCDIGVDLYQEEDASGFLGVNLERGEETGTLDMKRPILIDRVIIYVGLDDVMAKVNYTPDGSVPLVKNEDGIPDSDSFNHSSAI